MEKLSRIAADKADERGSLDMRLMQSEVDYVVAQKADASPRKRKKKKKKKRSSQSPCEMQSGAGQAPSRLGSRLPRLADERRTREEGGAQGGRGGKDRWRFNYCGKARRRSVVNSAPVPSFLDRLRQTAAAICGEAEKCTPVAPSVLEWSGLLVGVITYQ